MSVILASLLLTSPLLSFAQNDRIETKCWNFFANTCKILASGETASISLILKVTNDSAPLGYQIGLAKTFVIKSPIDPALCQVSGVRGYVHPNKNIPSSLFLQMQGSACANSFERLKTEPLVIEMTEVPTHQKEQVIDSVQLIVAPIK